MKINLQDSSIKRIRKILAQQSSFDMEAFVRSYLLTILWSEVDENGEQLSKNHGSEDFANETVRKATGDCENFIKDHFELVIPAMQQTGNDEDRLGLHFWLTRQHSGAGFYDGDWEPFGNQLTAAARRFDEENVFVDDDGLIYFQSFR